MHELKTRGTHPSHPQGGSRRNPPKTISTVTSPTNLLLRLLQRRRSGSPRQTMPRGTHPTSSRRNPPKIISTVISPINPLKRLPQRRRSGQQKRTRYVSLVHPDISVPNDFSCGGYVNAIAEKCFEKIRRCQRGMHHLQRSKYH